MICISKIYTSIQLIIKNKYRFSRLIFLIAIIMIAETTVAKYSIAYDSEYQISRHMKLDSNNSTSSDYIAGRYDKKTEDYELKTTDTIHPAKYFGLSGGTGKIYSDDFSGYFDFNMAMGSEMGENGAGELIIGGLVGRMDNDSKISACLKSDPLILNIGFRYKYFITKRDDKSNFFFILGTNYSHMFWDYNKNVRDEDGDLISSDNMGGIELMTGLGVNLMATEKMSIGFEILPSALFWFNADKAEFNNQTFSNLRSLKCRLFMNFF